MSAHTRLHIKMLKRRGVPDADPRVQGLMRRLAREDENTNSAQELRKTLNKFMKEESSNAGS